MILKKYLSTLLALFLVTGCNEDSPTSSNNNEDYSLNGRWVMVGFEQTVLYQFNDTHRYTIYSTNGDGVFGTLEDAIPNPNPYTKNYDGTITIDLFFGNSVTYTPEFSCEGRVINFWLSDDLIHSTLIKENFNTGNCY